MTIKNFTPHAITVETLDGARVEYPSDGIWRAEEVTEDVHPIGAIPVVRTKFSGPDWVKDLDCEVTAVIVSQPVADILVARRNRAVEAVSAAWAGSGPVGGTIAEAEEEGLWASRVRILTPDTGPSSVIRDSAGRVVAVRRLREW